MIDKQEPSSECKTWYANGWIDCLGYMAALAENGCRPADIFHSLCTHWSANLLSWAEYGTDPVPPEFMPD